MEPRREEQQKKPEPRAEPRAKRFRLVKLEERITPTKKKYTLGVGGGGLSIQ